MRLSQRVLHEGHDDDHIETVKIEGVEEYITFGADDDDDYEDEGFELPVWALMLGVMFIASFIAWVVFYFSYKHERVVENAKSSTRTRQESSSLESQADEHQEDRGLSIRKWEGNYSDPSQPRFCGLVGAASVHTTATGTSVSSDDSSVASGEPHAAQNDQCQSVRSSSTNRKSLVQLLAEPRCVLCSKRYEPGEHIAHSENPRCHHDYHQACLTRYWNTNKNVDGNCPVCKEPFVMQMTA